VDVSDWLQQPPVVEPVNPFQRGIFDGFEGSPRSSPVDYLSLVKTIDRFGQSVVIAIACRKWGQSKFLGIGARLPSETKRSD